MGPVADNTSFIESINNLKPHIIRFPGGSASDAYFWNAKQGVNPPDAPAKIFNASAVATEPGYNYGMTDYNWQCSLDNYYSMLLKTNNKGIITVNYGYARYGTGPNPVATAAHLAANWVRYDKGRTQLWEVGNENFGDWEWGYRINTAANQDQQPEYLTGALYAQHFQVFADSMRQAAKEVGNDIRIGAVTVEAPATASWQTTCVKTWNTGMMSGINNKADFYVVHSYFTPYNENSTGSTILNAALSVPKSIMDYVTQTLQTNGTSVKPVVLDEWNMFAQDSKQQVSNVSGLFAVLVMGEAITNKYGMATRWDLLNGWNNGNDHGLFSSGDEPSGLTKWSPRPSFYYMYFMQKMLGDRLVTSTSTTNVACYASTYSSGQLNVNLVNKSSADCNVQLNIKNFNKGSRYYWYSLQGGTDNGEFSGQVFINGTGPTLTAGGPANYTYIHARSATTTNGVFVTVPARGAVMMVIDKK
jgi:alpha-L-arabinofuranosidase